MQKLNDLDFVGALMNYWLEKSGMMYSLRSDAKNATAAYLVHQHGFEDSVDGRRTVNMPTPTTTLKFSSEVRLAYVLEIKLPDCCFRDAG